MGKKKTLYALLFTLIFGLLVPNFGQQANTVDNLHVKPPMISGGAESSILIEELKRNGDTSIKYQGDKSTRLKQGTNSPSSTASITTIEGINFDEDATNSGFYHIPPDPSGAIGPNHLVSVNNTSIEWFTKDGTNQNSQSLSSFFSSLSPATGTFDPKVLYDQYEGRFVVVTLERTHSSTDSTSFIYLAVSATSDPNGTWYYYAINSKINVSGTEYWADYPGFAIGTDGIYVTCNLFHFTTSAFGGVRLWVIDKGTTSGFYSGGTGSSVVLDPTIAGGNALTLQPAHMFGTPPAGVGTYLVGYSRLASGSNSFIEIYSVSNSVSSPIVTFPGFLNIGVIDDFGTGIPNAPQLGTSFEIETNDPRTFNAVWRNNSLYTGTIVVPPSGDPDAGQTTVHWIQVNTSTFTLTDNGNVGAEDLGAGTYTFFPSISVNAIGEMMIGFAASGPSIYPGAYYTFRFPYEAAGTVQSSKTLKAGVDYYYRVFGGSRNRWGDYTGSSVDPNNDITFCLFNEYALTRGTVLTSYPSEDGRWGTVFGVMPTLDITALLEGPYDAGTNTMSTTVSGLASFPLTQPFNTAPYNYAGMEQISSVPSGVVDWVLVTLRKDLNPSSPDPATAVDVASRAALLKTDGSIVDLNGSSSLGFSVEPGDYYIVVEHRNHLAIMSPNAVTIN